MTLLATEIHNHQDIDRAVIVFAADRRITLQGTSFDTSQKIFRVQGMQAGIGYFGLAAVPDRNQNRPIAEWLQDFLLTNSPWTDLEILASDLASQLNVVVPRTSRETYVSGFHVAGFSSRGVPEFWFVRNVDDDRATLFGEYGAREDFQSRDAAAVGPGEYQVYRNGDIRAHVTAWERIDQALGILLNTQDFRALSGPDDYAGWARFKMETIARFYQEYCTQSIIGEPIDAFAITQS